MSKITVEGVKKALSEVNDPDLHKDIVSLDFVKDIEINEGKVTFTLVLTTPACPLKESLRKACTDALNKMDEVKEVEIKFDSNVKGIKAKPIMEHLLPQAHNIIAVASGKGGVGKSSIAVNIACALSQKGASVGLLDADIYGPSMGLMLNVTERPEIENEKMVPVRAYGLFGMSIGFILDPDTPLIWRGPMVMKALEQLVKDVAWPEMDYLIVDLPPGTGDAQLTLTQKVAISGAVIVTTPNAVALIDARKGLAMFQKVNVPVIGIVENMSTFLCPHCGKETPIFSSHGGKETAEKLGVPFLGEVPIDPLVREGGDSGIPIVIAHPDSESSKALFRVAARIAQEVAILAEKR